MTSYAKIKPIHHHSLAGRRNRVAHASGKIYVTVFSGSATKMILYAAEGMHNDEIAARLDTRRELVWLWRKRFFTDRLAGLEERARPGRPRIFSPRPRRSG